MEDVYHNEGVSEFPFGRKLIQTELEDRRGGCLQVKRVAGVDILEDEGGESLVTVRLVVREEPHCQLDVRFLPLLTERDLQRNIVMKSECLSSHLSHMDQTQRDRASLRCVSNFHPQLDAVVI